MINVPEGFHARNSTIMKHYFVGMSIKQVIRSNLIQNAFGPNQHKETASRLPWEHKYSHRVADTISKYLSTKVSSSKLEYAGHR